MHMYKMADAEERVIADRMGRKVPIDNAMCFGKIDEQMDTPDR